MPGRNSFCVCVCVIFLPRFVHFVFRYNFFRFDLRVVFLPSFLHSIGTQSTAAWCMRAMKLVTRWSCIMTSSSSSSPSSEHFFFLFCFFSSSYTWKNCYVQNESMIWLLTFCVQHLLMKFSVILIYNNSFHWIRCSLYSVFVWKRCVCETLHLFTKIDLSSLFFLHFHIRKNLEN